MWYELGHSNSRYLSYYCHYECHICSLSIHSYQYQSIAILKKLREFFIKNPSNSIGLWDCLSNDKQPIYFIVNKEIKNFNFTLLFLYKSSWNFERKNKYNNISKIWKIMFQVSNTKGKHFLNLLDDDIHPMKPSYTKGGSQIKYFRHLNFLCIQVTRAIVNYTLIEEYHLHFLLNKNLSCSYEIYLVETKCYILYKCRRFNNYWNLR